MKMTPRWTRLISIDLGERQDQRHDDDDRREDVHHRADEQQEDVEASRNTPLRLDVRLRPLDQLRRDLRVDEVVRQADRHRQDEQHAADERDAVAGDAQHVARSSAGRDG